MLAPSFCRNIYIYIDPKQVSKGYGLLLYKALLSELSKTHLHPLIAGIALPNEVIIALHEKLGFEKVAQFREVGYKFEQWLDVGYWEYLVENKPES
ncbi:MAG: L-amino acid N-acyltransferase YncA [Bacteroidia bacterium]|jgi:L-amino acid N-acyltransferase YncA